MKQSTLTNYIQDLSNKTIKTKQLINLENNEYNNYLFGIHFNTPRDWFLVLSNEFEDLFSKQKLVGEYEHYKNELYKILEHPSLLMTKYDPKSDKYYGLVSPTLSFSITLKEPDFSDFDIIEYSELLNNVGEFGYPMLKDFQIVNRGTIFRISGFDSVIYNTEYLFESNEIEIGIKVEMSNLNIDYGDFILDFSMTDCKTQNQIATKEYSKLISSIRLVK